MTNNFENGEHEEHQDDFVEHEMGGHEESAGSKGGMTGNLAEAWRTRPMFKFMVLLVGVFAVGVAAFNFMGGGSSNNSSASLIRPPNMKGEVAAPTTPYIKKQTEMANQERSEKALSEGGSALPTPIGQVSNVGDFGGGDKKDDSLNELRSEVERLKLQNQQQQVQQQQVIQQVQQRPNEPFDNSLAEAMQRQMGQLLESWTPKGIKQVAVPKSEEAKNAETAAQQAATAGTAAASAASTATRSKILVPAGTVSYAQLMTEANSDVPGPILAQIVSGPLAGSRAVGSFEVSQGYEKYLVLKFTLADKKGKDYQLNAIALDPDTTLGGMATEVDERYMVRVVLPAAAGFLQSMGQALGQGNSSITTNGTTTISTTAGNGFKQGLYSGMGQAAQTMGQFFENQANLTKPLVRVAAGTPMGLFFTAPVLDNDINTNPVATATTQYGAGSATQASYPGTTVTGYGNTGTTNSGVPYPNYAMPGNGYNTNAVNRTGTTYPGYSQSYGQGYGQ